MTAARIAFRVDASDRIGTGHVMRCLTLANELRNSGAKTRFVCRAHHGHLAEKIADEHHEVILLPLASDAADRPVDEAQSGYAGWLGAVWSSDATETARALEDFAPFWLVLDHYAIDARWERQFRTHGAVKIMVIDGLANRAHDCDLLLDQTYSSAGAARWDGLVPASCRRLVGPQFALLRPEFISAQRRLRQRDGQVRRIFVAFGGVDEPNATAVALDAIAGLAQPDLVVDVVVGTANPHRRQLREKCRTLDNLHLHVQPPDVAELMAGADLAISAGGGLLLEQCFMHLPSIVVSIATNQIRPARALHERGAVLYAGAFNPEQPETTAQAIGQCLLHLLSAPERLTHIQAVARELMARPQHSVSQILQN